MILYIRQDNDRVISLYPCLVGYPALNTIFVVINTKSARNQRVWKRKLIPSGYYISQEWS